MILNTKVNEGGRSAQDRCFGMSTWSYSFSSTPEIPQSHVGSRRVAPFHAMQTSVLSGPLI